MRRLLLNHTTAAYPVLLHHLRREARWLFNYHHSPLTPSFFAPWQTCWILVSQQRLKIYQWSIVAHMSRLMWLALHSERLSTLCESIIFLQASFLRINLPVLLLMLQRRQAFLRINLLAGLPPAWILLIARRHVKSLVPRQQIERSELAEFERWRQHDVVLAAAELWGIVQVHEASEDFLWSLLLNLNLIGCVCLTSHYVLLIDLAAQDILDQGRAGGASQLAHQVPLVRWKLFRCDVLQRVSVLSISVIENWT